LTTSFRFFQEVLNWGSVYALPALQQFSDLAMGKEGGGGGGSEGEDEGGLGKRKFWAVEFNMPASVLECPLSSDR
jgi:hypothetical protein